MARLTDEQIAQEEAFMRGVPRFNVGAFFMPGIWGPAHGLWVSILFYPLWLLADNVFFAAFSQRTVLACVLAGAVFVFMTGLTLAFSLLGQPYAWHRAAARGVSKERYLAGQRIWAVACVALGLLAVGVATYYNLIVRVQMGA